MQKIIVENIQKSIFIFATVIVIVKIFLGGLFLRIIDIGEKNLFETWNIGVVEVNKIRVIWIRVIVIMIVIMGKQCYFLSNTLHCGRFWVDCEMRYWYHAIRQIIYLKKLLMSLQGNCYHREGKGSKTFFKDRSSGRKNFFKENLLS